MKPFSFMQFTVNWWHWRERELKPLKWSRQENDQWRWQRIHYSRIVNRLCEPSFTCANISSWRRNIVNHKSKQKLNSFTLSISSRVELCTVERCSMPEYSNNAIFAMHHMNTFQCTKYSIKYCIVMGTDQSPTHKILFVFQSYSNREWEFIKRTWCVHFNDWLIRPAIWQHTDTSWMDF